MILVDNLSVAEYKTKAVVSMLSAVGAGKKNLKDHRRHQREHLRRRERRQVHPERGRGQET